VSKRKKCTPQEFVKAWQASESVLQVAVETGLTLIAVRGRAASYRRHGVPLHKMNRGAGRKKTDWNALADLARKIKEGGE